MKKEVNYYTDGVCGCNKGSVTLDNQHYVAEMIMDNNEITLRIFDFNGEIARNFLEMRTVNKIAFHSELENYLLFGLELKESLHMKIGRYGKFNDYSYSVQGFIKSRKPLHQGTHFSGISICGENLKQWSGSTRKLYRIIQCGLVNQLPDKNDCTEFSEYISGLGVIGLYNSFRMGGLDGFHTVGMSVNPVFRITFEDETGLEELIERYIDLYMILRFLIGESIDISHVKVHDNSHHDHNDADFYFAEKKSEHPWGRTVMSIPYSSHYHDDSEKDFPSVIWDGYFNTNNRRTKDLIKRYVSYTMINNIDEKFLGFYRILETLTLKKSSYVDESDLTEFLNKNRESFSLSFPGTSISNLFRAIKRANQSKLNTESCIHHFINDFPKSVIDSLNLKNININDICTSRNKIIHQPLYTEATEKVYKFMQATEGLVFLAILCHLGVPVEKIKEIALFNNLQYIFSL